MKKFWGMIIFVLMLCAQTPSRADAATLEIHADAPDNNQVVWRISINEAPTALNSFGFDILYDAGKLRYSGTYEAGALAQGLSFFAVSEQPLSDEHVGHLTIGGFDITPIQQSVSGELVRITFDIIEEGDAQMRFANTVDDVEPDDGWDDNGSKAPIVPEGQGVTVDENSPPGTVIYTVSAADDEDDHLTYSMDGASGAFTIDPGSGEISVNAPLDYDVRAEYEVTLSVSDGEHTTSATATIQVNNQNNCPQANAQTFSAKEDSPEGTLVGTLAASDSDNDSLSYSITGGNAGNAFAIEQATGKISVSDADKLDYESTASYTLTVQVSDGECSQTATVTVNIGNVNEAPKADDGTFSIAENSTGGTAIGTVVAIDPEGDSLTCHITSGNGSNFFAVSSDTGQISLEDGAQPDYETTKNYVLTVEVSDGTYADTATVSINVTNQCPTVADQIFSVTENSVGGTKVGTILTNGDAPATFSIVPGTESGAKALFAVSNEGDITVSSDVLLDYEDSTSQAFTIEVSDGTCKDTARIGVNLVKQCPEISDQTFYVSEGSEKGTIIGSITAAGDEPQIFSITGGDPDNIFEIDSDTGEISVNDPSQLADSHSFTVAVSDGKCSNTATATVNINPASCSLTVEDAVFTVSGGSSSGTVAGTLVATYEGKELPTYSIISGNDDNVFSIDSHTGEVAVSEDKSLECDPASVGPLEVEVSDGECRDTAVIIVNMEEMILGDTDGNGKIGLNDATFALQILTGYYNGSMNLCADVSDDGKIGVEELAHILKSLVN